ncbi:MAG: hypothetical protein RIR04_510 [Pseudomonadota bacterium]|jgi:hypothetical protein
MKDREKLRRLAQISALLRGAKLHALQVAALARQESLDRLAALDAPQPAADLPAITAAEVALRYAVWSDHRRSEINLGLARQTAAWHRAQQDAALAFGRDQVVQGLAQAPNGLNRRAE